MKPRLKPRNPLVAPAKFRKAGAHEKTVTGQAGAPSCYQARGGALAAAEFPRVCCCQRFAPTKPLWHQWSARLFEEQEDAVRFGREAPGEPAGEQ